MFASKKLGLTLVLSSLLAACASAPKTTENVSGATIGAENGELDLEQLAKERASQGLVARKSELQDTTAKIIGDSSQEPQLAAVSDELKSLAAPVLKDYQRAVVLMKANQLDEAFNLFEEIQIKAPQLAGPLLNQALIHIQRQQYKEADILLQKAIALNTKNPFTYNVQGFVSRQLGQFKKAREAYEQALRLSPNYAKAHFNFGVLAELYLQDLPLALAHYEAYQNTQKEADATVAKWVIDLQQRTGVYQAPVRKPVITETPPVDEQQNIDNTTENTKNSAEMPTDTATSAQETVESPSAESGTTTAAGVQP